MSKVVQMRRPAPEPPPRYVSAARAQGPFATANAAMLRLRTTLSGSFTTPEQMMSAKRLAKQIAAEMKRLDEALSQ